MEGDFVTEAPTPLMAFSHSDRAILERAIMGVQGQLAIYVDEQREDTAKFYATRMMPLEALAVRTAMVAWFALGVGFSALVVAAGVMAIVLARL